MKILKGIGTVIALIILTAVYIVDSVILVLLPFVKRESIQEWLPKPTEFEAVMKELPSLSHEAITEICQHRIVMLDLVKNSIVRVVLAGFILMALYIVFY